MIHSEIVKQIETASLAERIEIAEIIIRSLRKDVKTDVVENKIRSVATQSFESEIPLLP